MVDGTNRHWYGFFLSVFTALLWGMLPVFLKLTLQVMDAITITWYRFFVAALFVALVLVKAKALPSLRGIDSKGKILLVLAALGLIANYVLYVQGLDYVNPETAQVVIQLAPFMLMLGGLIWFNERFNKVQTIGALVLFAGLLLFFNDKLAVLFSTLSVYTQGVLLILVAAITWAVYALLQKVLLRAMTAKQLTLYMYSAGALVLLPVSNVLSVAELSFLQLFALFFCCANTILAYGAFTEALYIWDASKVSAVIALAPLFTFLSMEAAVLIWPQHFTASALDIWAYIGAGLVMCGSVVTALGKDKSRS